MSAFRRRSLARMCSAKRNPGWERRPCSFSFLLSPTPFAHFGINNLTGLLLWLNLLTLDISIRNPWQKRMCDDNVHDIEHVLFLFSGGHWFSMDRLDIGSTFSELIIWSVQRSAHAHTAFSFFPQHGIFGRFISCVSCFSGFRLGSVPNSSAQHGFKNTTLASTKVNHLLLFNSRLLLL